MPKITMKTVPAWHYETKVAGREDAWVRSKGKGWSSAHQASRQAAAFIEEATMSGYEVSVHIVEDGTLTVRDYGGGDED